MDLPSLNFGQRRLLGLDDTGLVVHAEHRLLPDVVLAFTRLQAAAARAGFDLRIASAYRSFERQRLIWNSKLDGERPVYDDEDRLVALDGLGPQERLERVLRFSAMPGTSRHHWGTDIDVYDAAAMPAGYQLRLDVSEAADAGIFGPLHRWLDERIATGRSHGFYRPYDRDRGGVAPERWHLSYAPQARRVGANFDSELLRRVWRGCERFGAEGPVAEVEALCADLDGLLERFVRRVADAPADVLSYRP
ncbi:MAG: M15 family metallopeptidase [Pseudomonadota bacterium]